jgi:penicillin-binding protein-related factor A (putative recombinase)
MELRGTEFEAELVRAFAVYERAGRATFDRCGVQAARTPKGWIVIPSRPDFDGLYRKKHIIFDAKVCSQISFSWSKYKKGGKRSRQLAFMLNRSKFGSYCYFMIHWNPRETARTVRYPETHLLKVDAEDDYWSDVVSGRAKTLRFSECRDRSELVPWEKVGRCKLPMPHFLPALLK